MKKGKTKKRIFKSTANMIFWIVLIIVAIYSALALFSRDNLELRSFFGKTAMTVESDSMKPEFKKGDLLFINTNFNVDDIQKQDIITFLIFEDVNGDGDPEWVYNSHRVVDIQIGGNGDKWFITKGDNNASDDPEPLHQSFVVGVYTDHKINNIGGIIDGIVGFTKSGTGFFIFIVLPCFALLVYEVYKFVGVMSEYKAQQMTQDRVKLQEEAIAIAKAQLEEEAKQKGKKEVNSKEDV